ncbi:hypothetical protein ALC56_07529 [Trachymyrmex septentrionalis]|uniref:Uncharacterized protein n=1 Tax=Trachymyrmex septentrionalis TaxID=34720 RepID=A0A195FDL2_9HYME|nr:hypothetical protein ALC56_07529 [Trachymyrmex septentrionalis]
MSPYNLQSIPVERMTADTVKVHTVWTLSVGTFDIMDPRLHHSPPCCGLEKRL